MVRIQILLLALGVWSCGDNTEQGELSFGGLSETATLQGLPFSGTGAMTRAGDINGDHHVDLLLGQPMFGSSMAERLEGRIEIAHSDGAGGFSAPAGFLEGNVAQAHFGSELEVTDVDGDGIDDVLVGSCSRSYGGAPAPESGRIDLYRGSPRGLEMTPAWRLEGEFLSGLPDETGCTIDLVGDINGDGLSDLAVSWQRYYDGILSREVTIFANDLDGFSGRLWTFRGSSSYGSSAIGLGDVSGDGVDDFAIASPFDREGAIDIHSGADGRVLQRMVGSHQSSRFGRGVSAADIDGDGLTELLVGAPGMGGTGQVTLYRWLDGEFAPTWSFVSDRVEAPFAPVGRAQQIVGDVDGDGLRDILVGASFYYDGGSNVGRAWLFSGRPPHEPLWIDRGRGPESFFGAQVGSAGDTNGDGLADIWVASYELGFDNPSLSSGRVRIFSTSNP